MSHAQKTYFLAPSWDYLPDGPIKLGNIITGPSKAAQPLNVGTRLAPSNVLLPSFKSGVRWTRSNQQDGKYGVWTKFLSSLGIGVDVGFSHGRTEEEIFAFDRMQTVEFFPTQDYLDQSMTDPSVVYFLDKSRLKKQLYMITGIKTVTGAKVKRTMHTSRSGEMKVGLDGILTGAPVSLGPEVTLNKQDGESHSFEGSSDFVFAFRMKQIVVHKRQVVSSDDYVRGALYDVYDSTTEEMQDEFVSFLRVEDYRGAQAEHGSELVMDGDDELPCLCVNL